MIYSLHWLLLLNTPSLRTDLNYKSVLLKYLSEAIAIPIAFPQGLHDVLIVGHSSSATTKLVCAINVKPKQINPRYVHFPISCYWLSCSNKCLRVKWTACCRMQWSGDISLYKSTQYLHPLGPNCDYCWIVIRESYFCLWCGLCLMYSDLLLKTAVFQSVSVKTVFPFFFFFFF